MELIDLSQRLMDLQAEIAVLHDSARGKTGRERSAIYSRLMELSEAQDDLGEKVRTAVRQTAASLRTKLQQIQAALDTLDRIAESPELHPDDLPVLAGLEKLMEQPDAKNATPPVSAAPCSEPDADVESPPVSDAPAASSEAETGASPLTVQSPVPSTVAASTPVQAPRAADKPKPRTKQKHDERSKHGPASVLLVQQPKVPDLEAIMRNRPVYGPLPAPAISAPTRDKSHPMPDHRLTTDTVPTLHDTDAGGVAVEETAAAVPVVEERATEEPVVEDSVGEALVVEEPLAEESVTEESVTEESVTEGSVTEGSVTEGSVTGEPLVEGWVAEDPKDEQLADEESADEEHPDKISAEQLERYTQKCTELMLDGTLAKLAQGWLLSTWLEQKASAYPPQLPRPIDIEVAGITLPRMMARRPLVTSEVLAQYLVTATELVSSAHYQLSANQAHIRLALGLPLLLFAGVESAYSWVRTAQDQEEIGALRLWANLAVNYWQRTHMTLTDAGVIEVMEFEQRRAQLIDRIHDHYQGAAQMNINFAAGAKVRSIIFPTNGEGGLRWILGAVKSGELQRLMEWQKTFDADRMIDDSARLINRFRDKVDYTARAKLVEALHSLQVSVSEWCSTYQQKETSATGMLAQAREFAVEWRKSAPEFEYAIEHLPAEQAVARRWLSHTYQFFDHHLGGVCFE